MENWERSKFEDEWRDAFEGAEVAPSRAVWNSLEQELTYAEGKGMKRTIIFYKRLAAACVVFALAASTFGVYYWNESKKELTKNEANKVSPNSIARENEVIGKQGNNVASKAVGEAKREFEGEKKSEVLSKSLDEKNEVANKAKENVEVTAIDGKQKEEATDEKKSAVLSTFALEKNEALIRAEKDASGEVTMIQKEKAETTEAKNSDQTVAANDSKKVNKEKKSGFESSENKVASKITNEPTGAGLIQNENRQLLTSDEQKLAASNEEYFSKIDLSFGGLPELQGAQLKGEPVYVEIVRQLPAISPVFMKDYYDNKINHERAWATVTAAAGTFSNYNGGSSYSTSNSSGATPTGNSYTAGFLGGMRVANRWVLQSGLQYMNQSAGYSSNIATAGSLNAVSSYAANSKPSPSSVASAGSAYGIVSTNEFVTVPLLVGYLLVDGKIGLQINPGVATDFFVKNTLSDPSGQRQSYSQSAGSDSPYRSVNFAGLMSSEVSYKLGKSYRVSLVPGFRYSFNPMLKSQTTGYPMVWDVAFRLRYIFK